MFITFEGTDGSGKSTQVDLLCKHLTSQGYSVVSTREPGGTESAEQIRAVIMNNNINLSSELLLYIAARIEHCHSFIEPNLKAGKIVICDRFIDSTIVYQGYGMGFDTKTIDFLHSLLIPEKLQKPDCTIIIDVSTELALRRAHIQKYESMNSDFQKKISDGFRKIALENPKRCKLIDGRKNINEVHFDIIHIVDSLISVMIK